VHDVENPSPNGLIEMTTRIVAAFVSHNTMGANDIPNLIAQTHAALTRLNSAAPPERDDARTKISAKDIAKSITPEYLVCLEDNKQFKSLKRHLRTHYNLSPEQYRTKWNLPPDYPMVAANYARARSDLAKKMGLGTKREK
jgi:predicted transcriptional regulator